MQFSIIFSIIYLKSLKEQFHGHPRDVYTHTTMILEYHRIN